MNWLSVQDLEKRYTPRSLSWNAIAYEIERLKSNKSSVIANKLEELQSQMPDDIQPKLTRDGKIELYLRETAVDKFMALANLQTNQWLTTQDLMRGHYNIPSSLLWLVITNKLKELQPKIPNDIQPKLTSHGKTELCLRKTAVDKFIELANLQTCDWLNARDLCDHHTFLYKFSQKVIANKLEELKNQIPDDIQPKLTSNGKTELCLRKTAVNKFIELANIQTLDWLLPHEVVHNTNIASSAVAARLKELQAQMPNDIQPKLTHDGKTELCLRRTAVDKFLKLANIQTDKWLTAHDLKHERHRIPSPFSWDIIASKLKELQPKMPNYIKMKNTHNNTEELCLHSSQVATFRAHLLQQIDTDEFATDVTDDQMDAIATRLATQNIADTNADNVLLEELEKASKSNNNTRQRKKSVFDKGASVISTITDVNTAKQATIHTTTKPHTADK